MPYTFKHGDRPLEGITIQRAVGRGGFGEVYYAVADSGKQLALKYLRENPDIELRGIAQVMNLKSPHLVTIYDVRRSAAGEPFVLMEYVSGPSLRELLLAQPGGLGPRQAAFLVDGVARGLAYLHDRGIVHRDLKPANIFYDDGYVKIGDYGLSKHISVSQHSGQTVSVGTVHYMAPEIGSGSYTKAIDIYALGVILYEMLTGHLPFTGASMGEILMRHLSDRPSLTGIPEPFAGVIARALAKDPQHRFQDAHELADALRQSADISASIASFDPATLTRLPRHPAAEDPERMSPSPRRDDAGPSPAERPPPSAALDARASAATPDLPPGLSARLRHQLDRAGRKLDRAAGKLRRHGIDWHPDVDLDMLVREPARTRGPRRGFQLLVLLGVMVGVAVCLALWHGDHQSEEFGAMVAFTLAGGTFGPLLAYFRILTRAPARNRLWERLTYGSVTTLLLTPALALAAELGRGYVQGVVFAALAAALLCNWTKRIEAGRRGAVSTGRAISAGLVGLVVASMTPPHTLLFHAACICAVMSLLVELGASLWPVPRSTPAAPAVPPADVPAGADVAAPPAPPPVVDSRLPAAGTGDAAAPRAANVAVLAGTGSTAPAAGTIAAVPLFMGWVLRASLAFAGCGLLLAAVLLAGGLLDVVHQAIESEHILLPPEVRSVFDAGVLPPPRIVALALVGSALLLLARLGTDGPHVLRGCVGCVLALVGVALSLGPAAAQWRTLWYSDDWSQLDWADLTTRLLPTVAALLAAVVLLSWPRRRGPRRRATAEQAVPGRA